MSTTPTSRFAFVSLPSFLLCSVVNSPSSSVSLPGFPTMTPLGLNTYTNSQWTHISSPQAWPSDLDPHSFLSPPSNYLITSVSCSTLLCLVYFSLLHHCRASVWILFSKQLIPMIPFSFSFFFYTLPSAGWTGLIWSFWFYSLRKQQTRRAQPFTPVSSWPDVVQRPWRDWQKPGWRGRRTRVSVCVREREREGETCRPALC